MEDLVKAFNIFLKYSKGKYPIQCEHDEMIIHISPIGMKYEDIVTLNSLGFFVHNDSDDSYNGVGVDDNDIIIEDFEYCDEDYFLSYRYGSC